MLNRPKIYTVSEINGLARELLETSFNDIWIEGEISNFKLHTAGHLYFTLKDESAQINAVMYRGLAEVLKFRPEDGLKVLARGRLSCFVKRGIYQIVIYHMEPRGVGALQIAFEQLKERLRKEGLFDEEYKKPIPLLPENIGIVTSPTGAVIRDLLSVISRRFKDVHILIYPVHVQGDLASGEIVQAIEGLNREFKQLDVIILARGGGSLEDLWPFNEERVARAIFASKIPIISAVGHEVDYTISDFVSDLRAPTPSAAAELVVRNKLELMERISMLVSKLTSYIGYKITSLSSNLEALTSSKALTQPTWQYEQRQQEMDYLHTRLVDLFRHYIELAAKQLSMFTGKLDALSPLAVLERGYSIVWKLPEERILKQARDIDINDRLKVKLYKGEIFCRVEESNKED